MNKLWIAAALVAALTGCATSQTPVPITKYQNVVLVLPKSYTGHCGLPKPPDKKAYINATKDERINLLLKANSALMTSIKTCNDRWDQVDIWNDEQLKLYQDDPTAIFPGQAPASAAQGASAPASSK
jgi:hypothetical protein